jgi:hypothetical protein
MVVPSAGDVEMTTVVPPLKTAPDGGPGDGHGDPA